jgi:hypothetical protein
MNLRWYTGKAKGYPKISWVLFNTDPKDAAPFKALIGETNRVVHSVEGPYVIWVERGQRTTFEWEAVNLPPGLTPEEQQAMLLVEYRLRNAVV